MILGDRMRAAETRRLLEQLANDFHGLDGLDDDNGRLRTVLAVTLAGSEQALEDPARVVAVLDEVTGGLRGWGEVFLTDHLAAECVDLRDKAVRASHVEVEAGPLEAFRRASLSGPDDFSDIYSLLSAVRNEIDAGAACADDLYYDISESLEEFSSENLDQPHAAMTFLDDVLERFHAWPDHPDLLAATKRTREAARQAAATS